MRFFIAFLLGLIIGIIAMLFLPELTPRREQLNSEMRTQIDTLQAEVRDLGNQLKSITIFKPGTPTPTPK
ncbi:MAG: hypothetical protein JO076_09280 [Verrucomicrobia bacterium]|nr:hypothetical protein [Verrucomicrobiota bacterium]